MERKADFSQGLLTIDEAAELLRIGRTSLYALIAEGSILTVKIRGARRVPKASLIAFLESQTAAA